jgi:hypothetical protein
MKIDLYQEIALKRDFPEYNLHQGDIATLIDYVSHPANGEEGAILEVFNALVDLGRSTPILGKFKVQSSKLTLNFEL